MALVTPFDKNKEIDYPALERMVRHIAVGKADFIVVLGTTGETPTLSPDERNDIRRFVARLGKQLGIPLVAGLGGNNTAALVKEIMDTDLEGYSAILSVLSLIHI